MHRQGPIPLTILVDLSSYPIKGNTSHNFIDIRLTCVVVETSEYDNNLSLDSMTLIQLVSIDVEWGCVYIGQYDEIMDKNNKLSKTPS